MHKEAKQTQTSEFGAEKGLLQGSSKENRWLMLKTAKLPKGFRGRVLVGKIWDKGCRVCDVFSDWLVVTGWCSRNLVLSLKLPTSSWVGALFPAEEPEDIVMYIP